MTDRHQEHTVRHSCIAKYEEIYSVLKVTKLAALRIVIAATRS